MLENILNHLKTIQLSEHFGSGDPKINDIVATLLPEEHLVFDWGASKFVIIPKNEDFVIKIPFDSAYNDFWHDYEEFYCATGGDNWDYCYSEVIKYKEVCDAGLGMFFVPVKQVPNYTLSNNFPVYIQRKVEAFIDVEEDVSPSYKSINSAKHKSKGNIHDLWLAAAIDYYGEELVDKFLHYIFEEDLELGEDLHKGNLGFLDGAPVILDYAGFFE